MKGGSEQGEFGQHQEVAPWEISKYGKTVVRIERFPEWGIGRAVIYMAKIVPGGWNYQRIEGRAEEIFQNPSLSTGPRQNQYVTN